MCMSAYEGTKWKALTASASGSFPIIFSWTAVGCEGEIVRSFHQVCYDHGGGDRDGITI